MAKMPPPRKAAEIWNAEEAYRKIEEALMGIGGESIVEKDQPEAHIITRVTDEGHDHRDFRSGKPRSL